MYARFKLGGKSSRSEMLILPRTVVTQLLRHWSVVPAAAKGSEVEELKPVLLAPRSDGAATRGARRTGFNSSTSDPFATAGTTDQ